MTIDPNRTYVLQATKQLVAIAVDSLIASSQLLELIGESRKAERIAIGTAELQLIVPRRT